MDIEEDIKKISKRFQNGTETIEDILDYCKNYEITFENSTKIKLVDKKYLDKLVKEYKKLLAEREEDKKKIAELEAKLEFYQWGDLDNLKFEEYMKEFIPKQKVKDEFNKLNTRIKDFKDPEIKKYFSIEQIIYLLEQFKNKLLEDK